jgi:hypothetical protein
MKYAKAISHPKKCQKKIEETETNRKFRAKASKHPWQSMIKLDKMDRIEVDEDDNCDEYLFPFL